jgi:hypothetical protein
MSRQNWIKQFLHQEDRRQRVSLGMGRNKQAQAATPKNSGSPADAQLKQAPAPALQRDSALLPQWPGFRALRNACVNGWRPGDPPPPGVSINRNIQSDSQKSSTENAGPRQLPGEQYASNPGKAGGQDVPQKTPAKYQFEPLDLETNTLKIHEPETVDPYSESYNSKINQPLARVCEIGNTALALGIDSKKWKTVIDASTYAYSLAENVARQRGFTEGQKNAFRHAVWSCTLAKELGNPDEAMEIMLIHEDCDRTPQGKRHTDDSDTDIDNNRYGVSYALKHPDENCKAFAMEEIEMFRRKQRREKVKP